MQNVPVQIAQQREGWSVRTALLTDEGNSTPHQRDPALTMSLGAGLLTLSTKKADADEELANPEQLDVQIQSLGSNQPTSVKSSGEQGLAFTAIAEHGMAATTEQVPQSDSVIAFSSQEPAVTEPGDLSKNATLSNDQKTEISASQAPGHSSRNETSSNNEKTKIFASTDEVIQAPPADFVYSSGELSSGDETHPRFEPHDDSSQPVIAGSSDKPELIVQFSRNMNADDIAAVLQAVGATVGQTLRENGGPSGELGVLKVVKLGGGLSIDRAIEILEKQPGVSFAEPNFIVTTREVSNDPYFEEGSLWGMQGDTTSPGNVYGSHAADAWESGAIGSTGSIVGVIDTGLNATHADIYQNVWINQDEIPNSIGAKDVNGDGLITLHDLNAAENSDWVSDHNGNGYIDALDLLQDGRWSDGVDTDGNGYVDDLYGWDFIDDDNNPFESYEQKGPFNGKGTWHGTHVAGSIGATGGNGEGVVGVNWDVQLAAMRFIGSNGGTLADAILAIDYFTENAKTALDAENFVATNNSWGGGGFSQSLLDAITRGANEDILFVAAAGNDSANTDDGDYFPSNYDTSVNGASYDAVISVASTNETGGLSSFSNYGLNNVDLGAPGEDILSVFAGGGYAYASGTSMAAPHVAGAIALSAAQNPNMSAAELRDLLFSSTTPTSSLDGKTVTGGRLTIDDFIASVSSGPSVSITSVIDDTETTDRVLSSGDATDDTTPVLSGSVTNLEKMRVYVYANDTRIGESTVDGDTWTYTPDALLEGNYTFTVKVEDSDSNIVSVSNEFSLTVDTTPPTVSLTTNDEVVIEGETSQITFTFDDAAQEFELSDVTATGGSVSDLTTDDDKTWIATFTPELDYDRDGTVAVAADSYTDEAGNLGSGAEIIFTVDTVAPSTPTVDPLNTEDTTPTVTGTAMLETNDRIEVEIAGHVYSEGDISVDSTAGTWQVQVTSDLADSTYEVVARVTDENGNISVDTTSDELTIDTGTTTDTVTASTDGNDTIEGTAGDDFITGVPEGSTLNGKDSIDILWGYWGADTFVLGDDLAVYYDDGNDRSGNTGKNDYARIEDFTASEGDKIQLSGSSTDYFLDDSWTIDGISGTAIIHDSDGDLKYENKDEMIGFVVGIQSMDSGDFLFV